MRRSKTFAAALLAAGAVTLPLGALAGAAPAQSSPDGSACNDLGMLSQPVCQAVAGIEALLAPTDPVVTPVTEAVQPVLDAAAPVTEAVAPVTEAVAPAAPAPVAPTPAQPNPAPAPAEGSSAAPAGSDTQATSAGPSTAFSAVLSSGASGFAGPSRAPSGFSLELSPLGVPSLSIGSDFAAPALDNDLPLPTAGPFAPVVEAVTAGASSSSDESKATAAVLALIALALAAGLLIDQVRKAKAPFTIG